MPNQASIKSPALPLPHNIYNRHQESIVAKCATTLQACFPTRQLHPPFTPATENDEATPEEDIATVMNEVPKALKRMGRLREPGPLGMRPEHLTTLSQHQDYGDAFAYVVAHVGIGRIPPDVLQYLRQGQITPKTKPPDDYRPLLLTNILRRLGTKALATSQKSKIQA